MISILDLNLGNIKSLENCLNYMGVKFKKINSKKDIDSAKKIIIPGVGSFDFAMTFLKKKNYISSLRKFALIKKRPIILTHTINLLNQMMEFILKKRSTDTFTLEDYEQQSKNLDELESLLD